MYLKLQEPNLQCHGHFQVEEFYRMQAIVILEQYELRDMVYSYNNTNSKAIV